MTESHEKDTQQRFLSHGRRPVAEHIVISDHQVLVTDSQVSVSASMVLASYLRVSHSALVADSWFLVSD